ncbi:hypothetical protein UZ36_02750 [Candidatus Nitromaritima sp. SCGC AAA799-C22]|nr:hypothetical protein UZ36_02750 [Candidatus Nitromaritima sp. SCGC AAA799-C22]
MKRVPYLTIFVVLLFSFLAGGCWANESNTWDDRKITGKKSQSHKKLAGASSAPRLQHEMDFDYFKGAIKGNPKNEI